EQRGVESLEDAFIAWLEEAVEETEEGASAASEAAETPSAGTRPGEVEAPPGQRDFDLRRLFSYARRESLELRRDPIRATMALLGSVILMFIIGYGISMDVEELTFAVLDRDQTTASRDYTLGLAGSPYFVEQEPLSGYDDLDRRMRAGTLNLAI